MRYRVLMTMTSGTTYVSLKDTNVAIRAALRDAFPGVKFSVVGDRYSMGASTAVGWIDGPATNDVRKVVARFEGKRFDGMDDSTHILHDLVDGQPVHWGSDYVQCSRRISEQATAALTARLRDLLGDPNATLDAYHVITDPLIALGYPADYGTANGHQIISWLAEHDATAPTPARTSGEQSDTDTSELARRAV